MANYEMTLVLPEGASAAKEKSTTDMVEKLAKTFEGSVKKTDKWGKLPLAYAVEKNNSGIFMHYKIEMTEKGAAEMEQKIRLEEGIIRHLLVKSK